MEIERKYLLNSIPFELTQFDKTELSQTYISTDPAIRLRKSVSNTTEKHTLTIKSDGLLEREEFELALTIEQYERLLLKAETNPINKTRHTIPLNKTLIAELDVFHGYLDGLLMVEVEFENQSEANSFIPPSWFGKDVTFDPLFTNTMLARRN